MNRMHPESECGRVPRRSFLLSALFLCSQPRLLRAAQDTTFSTDVKVVNVLATVRDKHGQIIANLNKDDFTLEEDGRMQAIRYFSRETNLPLTLGLLIDTSLSQRHVLSAERSASYSFLDHVLREDKDTAFVIHFDREVELLRDLTSSRKDLQAALSQLEMPSGGRGGGYPYPSGSRGRRGGGTILYDAVLLASDELMKKQRGRKAVIVLSDGVDTGSKVSLARAIESAQRADTLVYAILFADEQAYGRGGMGGGPRMGRRPPMAVAHTAVVAGGTRNPVPTAKRFFSRWRRKRGAHSLRSRRNSRSSRSTSAFRKSYAASTISATRRSRPMPRRDSAKYASLPNRRDWWCRREMAITRTGSVGVSAGRPSD